MADQSKIRNGTNVLELLRDLLMANNSRKMLSITVLLIIGFLLHIRNKKTDIDFLPASRLQNQQSKKTKVSSLLFRVEKGTSMRCFGRGSKSWSRSSYLHGIALK